MLCDNTFEIISKFGTVLWHAARKRVARGVVRVPNMVDVWKQLGSKRLAIVLKAANRNSAKPNAVVPLLTPNKAHTLWLGASTMVRERNLERRIHRL